MMHHQTESNELINFIILHQRETERKECKGHLGDGEVSEWEKGGSLRG